MSDYEPPMPIMKAVAASISQSTGQNVRTLREQDGQVQEMHADMVKAVCSRRSDYPEDVFRAYLKRHIVEAEARGAAEQRRKDAEGSRSVHQWRLTADDEWVNAVDLVELEQVRNVYPNSETRTLYTRPANVAALEARIAELQAENNHQRTQILEFRNDDRRIRLAAERVCSVREGSEIFEARIALRAALTREGGV